MMSRREKTKRRQRAVRRAVVSTIWGIALCALAVIAMPSLLSASGLANGADAPVKVTILPRTAAPAATPRPSPPGADRDAPEAEAPAPTGDAAGPEQEPGEKPAEGSKPPEAEAEPPETEAEEPVNGPEAPAEEPFAAVPESEAVDDSYFADAAFIGDSRTQGLRLYSGLKDTNWLCSVGLTVETAATEKFSVADGKYTALDALGVLKPAKVYIMLGLNELGWKSADIFIEKYAAIIDAALAANQDCLVYVQSILPVSAAKDAGGTWCNNANVNERNERLKELAEEKGVYYLDVASAFRGEDGCLPAGDTPDGIHLTPGLCVSWLDYLKTHTVTEETP